MSTLVSVSHLLDKVVVGSYMGMLRIFSPHASKSSEEVQADAQLLEVQLQNAIIQVDLGKFVSYVVLTLRVLILHPENELWFMCVFVCYN